VDKRFVRKDGSDVWVRRDAAVMRDPSGEVRYIVGAFVDLTEQRSKDRALQHAASELERHLHFTRALLDAIPNPVYFKDREGRYQAYNRAWAELVGNGTDWIGKAAVDGLDPALAALHQERDRTLLERPSSTTYEAIVQNAAGESRQMLYNKVSFVDQRGEVAGLIGVITDVTYYKETERALEASEARFRVLTESSLDLISVMAEDGTILYQSAVLRNLVGYDPGETIGRSVYDLVHRDDADLVRTALRRIVETHQPSAPIEFRLRHRDGAWRTFESLGTNCLSNPHIRGIVFNSRDVTDRKVIQQRIQHLAYHDNLTGLPNRSLLQDRLAHSIARAERSGRKVGVLFIDLDNFKNINDTLGHDVGDELLRQVSRRLTECVRLEDTIARQGGDEFIVLLDSLDDGRGASVVAQKILNTLRQPFQLGATEQHVSGSVGIALYPEDGRDPQTLMKSADTAMFHGKGLGKNTYQYFTAQMNIAVKRRMTLESALRRAVMQKDFMLHYQPQINLETGEIIAVEALVRWKTEDSGTVMPADFIPLAEETGLIIEIGRRVLARACRQAADWQSQLPGLTLCVNLSVRQLQAPGLLGDVTVALEQSGLPADRLVLEITESVLMEDVDRSIRALYALKALGIRLAIDDFGTGHSSLSYLRQLPVDILKIDRSFVAELRGDSDGQTIVGVVINLGHSLGLRIVAEGVEDPWQLSALRVAACDEAQGFLLARPLPPERIAELLASGVQIPPRGGLESAVA
jgi:diguanylate cyclase (GGDEF)-like protein/PAS domain S-box-containing protein